MLNIDEIKKFYEPKYDKFSQFLYKEYLQYLILKIIFETNISDKLSFLWWTNLRLVHNNQRFSEDLDFDNFGLTIEEFDNLSLIIKQKLELEWLEVEIKNVYKWAFRCYIKIPKVLYSLWFSNLEEEKILIQIDTVPHWFKYNIDNKVFNKFWLFFKINTTPISILLSQKIRAIFNRPRKKWRDFFDIVYLFSLTKPNFEYLKEKLWFEDFESMNKEILKLCDSLDFKELAQDVKPFLIHQDEIHRVMLFREFIESL